MFIAKQAPVRNASRAIRTLTVAEMEAVGGGEATPAGEGSSTGPYNPNSPHKPFNETN
jgi:hypothetical protein